MENYLCLGDWAACPRQPERLRWLNWMWQMIVLKKSCLRTSRNETEDMWFLRNTAIFGALNETQKKGQLFGLQNLITVWYNVQDLGVGRGIILKWILKDYDTRTWIDCLRIETSDGLFWTRKKPSVFINPSSWFTTRGTVSCTRIILADPCGRAVLPAAACLDFGLEPRRGYGSLSVVNVVLCR